MGKLQRRDGWVEEFGEKLGIIWYTGRREPGFRGEIDIGGVFGGFSY